MAIFSGYSNPAFGLISIENADLCLFRHVLLDFPSYAEFRFIQEFTEQAYRAVCGRRIRDGVSVNCSLCQKRPVKRFPSGEVEKKKKKKKKKGERKKERKKKTRSLFRPIGTTKDTIHPFWSARIFFFFFFFFFFLFYLPSTSPEVRERKKRSTSNARDRLLCPRLPVVLTTLADER